MLQDKSTPLRTAFDKLESTISASKFFNGNDIGMVDVAWLPILHRTLMVETLSGYDFIGEHTKPKAWRANILASGLCERSVAQDFEQSFAQFYLLSQTYLG